MKIYINNITGGRPVHVGPTVFGTWTHIHSMIDVMTIMIDDFDDYDDGEDIDKQRQVAIADNFSYVDPVDGSKAAKQGIRVNTIITTTTTTNHHHHQQHRRRHECQCDPDHYHLMFNCSRLDIITSTTITSDTIIIITQGSQIICDRYDVIYHDYHITLI